MTKTLAALAALAVFPLGSEAQTLLLEYQGKVATADASPHWSYSPGDRVQGVVRIYPLLAPPDRRSADFAGDYVSGGPVNDFIVSDLVTGNRHDDALFVNVGPLDQPDRYTVSDIGSIEGGNSADFLNFTIEVSGKDFVRDDGIVQSFEAIPKKDGSSIVSALLQGVGELRRTVTFALSRVSVSVCRP